MGHVYLIKSDSGSYKIGRSVDAKARLKQLTGLPFGVTLDHVIETNNPGCLESYLHRMFAHRCIRYEWFALTAEDVEYVKSVTRVEYPKSASVKPIIQRSARSVSYALELLELTIRNGGGAGTLIHTAPALGIGGGRWSRGISQLEPYLTIRQGRNGGTFITSEQYPTVYDLHRAVRDGRVKLK